MEINNTTKNLQTRVIIPIYKKIGHKQSTNYREISLLSLPGKLYAKCPEKKCQQIIKLALEEGQCCFRPGRSTTNQIFTLKQILEYAKEVGVCQGRFD